MKIITRFLVTGRLNLLRKSRTLNIRTSSTDSRNQDEASDDSPLKTVKYPKRNVEDLLGNSALGLGPHDVVDKDDQWLTSPYPTGTVFHANQSQAQHSLRPRVDPKETSIILFPGQGAQYVGMGRELLKYPKSRDLFEAANQILHFDLTKLMLTGPKERLNSIVNSELAVFVCSLAAIEKLKEDNPTAIETCMATAGFSVGEISALTFAGAFAFDEALYLVKVRAEAAKYASEITPGGTALVFIKSDTKLGFACEKAKEWCLERGIENPECRVVQYLGPNTKAVGGHMEALNYLQKNQHIFNIQSVSITRNIGAFHSELMSPAVRKIKRKIERITVREPLISVHRNYDGKVYTNASQIQTEFCKQIARPIRWEQMLHILYERQKGSNHPYTYICGPGTELLTLLQNVNAAAAQSCICISV